MGPAVVLYDRDCEFCRWSMRILLRWDRAGRLRAVALQDAEADRLLASIDPEKRPASWHLVTPDGRLHSAGEAVPALLRLLPGGRPLAVLSEAFPGTTERLYRWTARHRGELGRLVPRGPPQ